MAVWDYNNLTDSDIVVGGYTLPRYGELRFTTNISVLDDLNDGTQVSVYKDGSLVQPNYVTIKPSTGELYTKGNRVSVSGNSTGLSGVTYDGSNRVIGYTLNDIAYTVTGWGTQTVTITGSNDSIRTLSLDESGRFVGVV